MHVALAPDRDPPDRDPVDVIHEMFTRAAGLVEVARLLLDAGADPNTTVGSAPGHRDYCSTLFAAAGCANHPGVTELLLQRGARFDDHTVYLAAFHADRNRATPDRGRQIRGGEGHQCLRLLLAHGGLPRHCGR